MADWWDDEYRHLPSDNLLQEERRHSLPDCGVRVPRRLHRLPWQELQPNRWRFVFRHRVFWVPGASRGQADIRSRMFPKYLPSVGGKGQHGFRFPDSWWAGCFFLCRFVPETVLRWRYQSHPGLDPVFRQKENRSFPAVIKWLFDTVTMYFRFLSCLPILLCCYLQKTMSLTKTFDWRFLQILYHSITTKVVAINIQASEEWYRTFSSITPLSLLTHGAFVI